MKIAVIGAGAIGSVIGAYLSDKHEVILIAKRDQVEAINSGGLLIKGLLGERLFRIKAKEKLDEKCALAILCTKTQDVKDALSANLDFIKDSLILTSQNGVRADELAAELIDKNNLLSSIVMFGATYLKPAEVIHNFEGNWILGSFFGGNERKLDLIEPVLKESFKIVKTKDIVGMKWAKVFVNFNNCLPALLGKSMQETFANLDISKISIRLLAEGLNTVDRAGIKLASLPDFDINKFRALASMPLDQAAGIFSGIMKGLSKEPLYGSILQSIKRDRPSEIDYINGEIVRLGKERNIPTPLNERIVQMVKNVEKTKQFLTPQGVIDGTST